MPRKIMQKCILLGASDELMIQNIFIFLSGLVPLQQYVELRFIGPHYFPIFSCFFGISLRTSVYLGA